MVSASDLISEYTKLDDWLTAERKRFDAHCKPHVDRMKAIEADLQQQLLDINQGKPEGKRASISTDAGTAYLSTIMTPKVSDKEKYLDWTLDNWEKWGAMLQVGAPQKDALREYMDANEGRTPPFISVDYFIKCNIRRS